MTRKIIPDIIDEQKIASLPGDCSIREAGRYMVEQGVGSVLVIEDGKLKGIFTERDALRIFVATRRNPDQTNMADVMTGNLQTISPDASPEEALKRMTEGKFRHMPVVDDAGKILGVISQRDLLVAFE
ncbi:MAG: CBS domain-containing protein [Rhodospirillales bacterium]|nr:CBS domain-containing protein [Rhodospirillales bacterium]